MDHQQILDVPGETTSKTLYLRRKALAGGEAATGIAFRMCYAEHEGGAAEVEIADLGALHEFPQCPSGNDLSIFLGEWMTLVQEQGGDLPPRHLTTLLLKMLPVDVYNDVKRMNMLSADYREIVKYLKVDMHRWIDKKRSLSNMSRGALLHSRAPRRGCSHSWNVRRLPKGQAKTAYPNNFS